MKRLEKLLRSLRTEMEECFFCAVWGTEMQGNVLGRGKGKPHDNQMQNKS